MTAHQAEIEGYNRLSCFLNGVKYLPPASLSAAPAKPEPRKVKSLAEILDEELAASEAAAKPSTQPAESEQPVLLSADQARARKVPTLVEILNNEALAAGDEYATPHKFNIRPDRVVIIR